MVLREGFAALFLCSVIALALPNSAHAVTQEELDSAESRLETLGGELATLNSSLAELTAQSDDLGAAADAKGQEVVKAQENLDALRDSLSANVRDSYKYDDYSLMDFVLSSTSIEDFVSRLYYANKVNREHAASIDAVEQAIAKLSQEQAELNAKKEEQDAKTEELLARTKEYQNSVAEAASVYNSLDAQAQAELAQKQEGNNDLVTAVKAARESNVSAEQLKEQEIASGEPALSEAVESKKEESQQQTPAPDSDNPSWSPSTNSTDLSGVQRGQDTYLAEVTWTNDDAYINALAAKAQSIGSDTNYFVTFDNELCRVIVFQRSGGTWRPVKLWNCEGAYRTWGGVWKVEHKRICNWADEYFGKGINDWSTCYIEAYSDDSQGHLRYVPGKGYEDCAAIHASGNTRVSNSNSGCAGLLWDNAKWVYDNVPVGSTVYEFLYSDLL